MESTLNKRDKIVLAKYWIYRLEDIFGEELYASGEFKKYYLPLKNYLRDKLGKDEQLPLEKRIELEYSVPLKYFDKNYEKIRDNKFPSLFKVIIVNKFHYNGNRKQWVTCTNHYDHYEDIAQHLPSIKNCSSQTLFDIPSSKKFARNYIEMKKHLEKYKEDEDDWCVRKFSDMNKFLNIITPKPLSDYIETLLDQINQEKLNLVNTKEKQKELKNIGDGKKKNEKQYADELGKKQIQGNLLRWDGAKWFIRFNEIEKYVDNTKGMHIIAYLIKMQGTRIRADVIYQDIMSTIINKSKIQSEMHQEKLLEEDNLSTDFGKKEEMFVVDKEAVTDINNARKKIEEKLNIAELERDIPKINKYALQIKDLEKWLSQNTDKFGKPRQIINILDKARKALFAVVKTAKNNIKEDHSDSLYNHLDDYLKTGEYPIYHPNTPVEWEVIK